MDSERKKIALDMDDTLADTLSVAVRRINAEHGTSLTKANFKDWHMANLQAEHGISRESTYRVYHEAWVNEWESIPALASSALLAEALKHYEIHIVTSRSEGSIDYCRKWLEKHYGGLELGRIVRIDGVHNKATLDYDIFMDDGPTLAKAMTEISPSGKRLMLIDQLYNRGINDDGATIIRVRDVNEALRLALELKDSTAQKARDRGKSRN